MVFDPLGVDRGRFLVNSNRQQELVNDFMSPAGGFRQFGTFRSKFDGSVAFRGNEAVSLKPGNGSIHGDMRDSKMLGQVSDAALATRFDQVGDRFDVILGQLRRMIVTSPLVLFFPHGPLRHNRLAEKEIHRHPPVRIVNHASDFTARAALQHALR